MRQVVLSHLLQPGDDYFAVRSTAFVNNSLMELFIKERSKIMAYKIYWAGRYLNEDAY